MNEQDKNPQKDQIDKLFGELEQLAQQQQMDLGSDLSTLKAKMVPVLRTGRPPPAVPGIRFAWHGMSRDLDPWSIST